jgi:3-oxoacyl-[acyl-carrier-protein] synthase III
VKYQRVTIDSVAYELAPDVVTSEEIEERLAPLYKVLKLTPGQLEALTGINERRYWPAGFSVAEGAAQAAAKLLNTSPVPPEAIEALIYGGVCREYFEPATACHVASALGREGLTLHPRATIQDIGNACLGVMSGMLDVANRIELGQIRAGLVVSCESSRDIVDIVIDEMLQDPRMDTFKDGLATLTGGSGAVAVLLTDGSFNQQRGHRLLGGTTGADPQFDRLCRWGMTRDGERTVQNRYRQFMQTDAAAVLEHGVELGARTWDAFLGEMDWTVEQVDRVVCHQVGSMHRSMILQRMGIPEEKDFVAYDFLGNTGTVALPLALALAQERGFVSAGDNLGLLGIGSGLNCVMLGVKW